MPPELLFPSRGVIMQSLWNSQDYIIQSKPIKPDPSISFNFCPQKHRPVAPMLPPNRLPEPSRTPSNPHPFISIDVHPYPIHLIYLNLRSSHIHSYPHPEYYHWYPRNIPTFSELVAGLQKLGLVAALIQLRHGGPGDLRLPQIRQVLRREARGQRPRPVRYWLILRYIT